MAGVYYRIGSNAGRAVAFVPAGTLPSCRTRREVGMYSGSKYRFCVPQNRLTERGAAGHGSGKEMAR